MKETKAMLHVSSGLVVVFSLLTAIARTQSIPREVQAGLEKYAALDPISFDWEGACIEDARGVTREFSVKSSYSRIGQKFFWMEELREKNGKAPKGGSAPAFTRTCRFDGDVVSATSGGNEASWYKIANLIRTQPKASRFQMPYCEAVGIYCPTRLEELPKGVLQSNIHHLIQDGAKLVSCEETHLEQEVVVRIEIVAENPAWGEFVGDADNMMKYEKDRLKNKNISQLEFDEIVKTRQARKTAMPQKLRWVYYLSPKNHYAVRKHERLAMDGKVIASYSNDSFRSIPETDVILPGRVKASLFEIIGSHSYELLNAPASTIDLSVVKVSTETIPKQHFVLDMQEVVPGATVIDAVTPGLQRTDGSVITFAMPASPDDLDAAIAAATHKYGNNRPRGYRLYIWVILPLVVMLILFFRKYARRKVFDR